jgi:hypothetical protein
MEMVYSLSASCRKWIQIPLLKDPAGKKVCFTAIAYLFEYLGFNLLSYLNSREVSRFNREAGSTIGTMFGIPSKSVFLPFAALLVTMNWGTGGAAFILMRNEKLPSAEVINVTVFAGKFWLEMRMRAMQERVKA